VTGLGDVATGSGNTATTSGDASAGLETSSTVSAPLTLFLPRTSSLAGSAHATSSSTVNSAVAIRGKVVCFIEN
jgi:hypothetical protein